MDIYLLRHGDALPVGAPGIKTDDQRPLSDNGRKEIRAAAAALRRLELGGARVLSSPLTRARETAEIVAETLGHLPILLWEELGHSFSSPGLLGRLRELPPEECVILVGHQPDLGCFASFLLSGDPDALDIPLKKGGVCCIQFGKKPAAGKGTICWLLTRKQLAMMAS